ncbi:MAG: hypothetical protein NUW37_13965 [Planctomycetes bacterium]|nr:hypothetical protein [Planctomycetota bacterium]
MAQTRVAVVGGGLAGLSSAMKLVFALLIFLAACDSPSSLNLVSATKGEIAEESEVVAEVEAARNQGSELRHRGRDLGDGRGRDDRGRGQRNSRKRNRLDVTVRIPEGSLEEDARISLSFPRRSSMSKDRRFSRLTEVIRIEPSGLSMRFPAEVELVSDAFENLTNEQIENLAVFSNHPNEGEFNIVETVCVDREAGKIIFCTPHFSDFVVTTNVSVETPNDEIAAIDSAICDLRDEQDMSSAAFSRLQLAHAFLEGNEMGDPISNVRLFLELGDTPAVLRKLYATVHQIYFASETGVNCGNILERLVRVARTTAIEYLAGGYSQMIAIAEQAEIERNWEAAAFAYSQVSSSEDNSNAQTAASALARPAAEPDPIAIPDYNPNIGGLWKFLVGGEQYIVSPQVTPAFDFNGFNHPGDIFVHFPHGDGSFVFDPQEQDDFGTLYNISSTDVAIGGNVKYQTNGFGAAPGTPVDPRWVGSDPYLGKYDGSHTLSNSTIIGPANGNHTGSQNFFYRDETVMPPVIRNATLLVFGNFNTDIERINVVEAKNRETGEVRAVSVDASGQTSSGEPLYICDTTIVDFTSFLHYSLDPSYTAWFVYKDGNQIAFGGGGTTYSYEFPRPVDEIEIYEVECRTVPKTGTLDVEGLLTRIVAVRPEPSVIGEVYDDMGALVDERLIDKYENDSNIAEFDSQPLETVYTFSWETYVKNPIDDSIMDCPRNWTMNVLEETPDEPIPHPLLAINSPPGGNFAEVQFLAFGEALLEFLVTLAPGIVTDFQVRLKGKSPNDIDLTPESLIGCLNGVPQTFIGEKEKDSGNEVLLRLLLDEDEIWNSDQGLVQNDWITVTDITVDDSKKLITIIFREVGSYELQAFVQGNDTLRDSSTIKIYDIVPGIGLAQDNYWQLGENVEFDAIVRGPDLDNATLTVNLSEAFEEGGQGDEVGDPGQIVGDERPYHFSASIREMINDPRYFETSINFTLENGADILTCLYVNVFILESESAVPLLSAIIFDYNLGSSDNDAIGIRRFLDVQPSVNQGGAARIDGFNIQEVTFEQGDLIIQYPGWTPANESNQITETPLQRNWSRLSNLDRYNDSPALYRIGANNITILVQLEVDDSIFDGNNEPYFDYLVVAAGTVSGNGNILFQVPITTVRFNRDGTLESTINGIYLTSPIDGLIALPLEVMPGFSNVNLYDLSLTWSVEPPQEVHPSGSGFIPMKMRVRDDTLFPAVSKHRIYSIIDEPVLPFVSEEILSPDQTGFSKTWTDILDLICAPAAFTAPGLYPDEFYEFRSVGGWDDPVDIAANFERSIHDLDIRFEQAVNRTLRINYTGSPNFFPLRRYSAIGNAPRFANQDSLFHWSDKAFDLQCAFDILFNTANIIADNNLADIYNERFDDTTVYIGCYDLAALMALFCRSIGLDVDFLYARTFLTEAEVFQMTGKLQYNQDGSYYRATQEVTTVFELEPERVATGGGFFSSHAYNCLEGGILPRDQLAPNAFPLNSDYGGTPSEFTVLTICMTLS